MYVERGRGMKKKIVAWDRGPASLGHQKFGILSGPDSGKSYKGRKIDKYRAGNTICTKKKKTKGGGGGFLTESKKIAIKS
jgi:hypothetical protein